MSEGSRYRFYALDSSKVLARARFRQPAPKGEFWKPSLEEVAPAGVKGAVFVVWWLMHQLRLFANRDYAQYVVREDDRVIHRSGIYPRYLRFPFMGTDDLQIGDTWTDPDYRGRGLATEAVASIVGARARPGRRFWYVVSDDNTASVRAIEKAGFSLSGVGERRPRLGLRALGAYVLTQSTSPSHSLDR